jgi:CRP-like cAMP-binding protein
MNISRQDLASIVGIAPETTIRTLSDFKDEGLVDIKTRGGIIFVTQYDKLTQMRN